MNREDYIGAVNLYSNMVYRIALNDCKSVEDAEDVMQNVFLKLYQCRKQFEDEEYRKRWLMRAREKLRNVLEPEGIRYERA